MNENKIHRYTHIFLDKTKITLTCDLSSDIPKITSDPVINAETFNNHCEYDFWLFNYVLPDIQNRLSPAQRKNLAKIGVEKLK